MRRVRVAMMGAMIAGASVMAGCVDQSGNAARFCDRNTEVLNESNDDQILSEDQAVYFSDEVEKTMRYAEDSTRPVRRAARRLADAYGDVRAIAGDDDVDQEDVDERYTMLFLRRVEMREVCAEVAGSGDQVGEKPA